MGGGNLLGPESRHSKDWQIESPFLILWVVVREEKAKKEAEEQAKK